MPNASLMVIEHAERFGLAQLHQLRGRVGRGSAASVCVLMYAAPLSPTARNRLKAMAETTDGFEIARRDLEIRGPGEFMGARQSGDQLLRFADLEEECPAAGPRAAHCTPVAGTRARRRLRPRRTVAGRQAGMDEGMTRPQADRGSIPGPAWPRDSSQ